MNSHDLQELVLRVRPSVKDWRMAQLALAAMKCGRANAPAPGDEEKAVDWGKKLADELERGPGFDVFAYALWRPLRRLIPTVADELGKDILSADIAAYTCRPIDELRALIEVGVCALELLLKRSIDAGLLELSHYEKGNTRVQDYTCEEGLIDALICCDLFDSGAGSDAFDRFVRGKMIKASDRTLSRGDRQWDKHLRLSSSSEWHDQRVPKGLFPVGLLRSEAPDASRALYANELLKRLGGVIQSVLDAARSDAGAAALKGYWYPVLRDERPKLDPTAKRAFFMAVTGSTIRPTAMEFIDTNPNAGLDVLLKRRRWLALTWKERSRSI
jgi:hypothetical protein